MKEKVKVMKKRAITKELFYPLQLYRVVYKRIVQGVSMSQ